MLSGLVIKVELPRTLLQTPNVILETQFPKPSMIPVKNLGKKNQGKTLKFKLYHGVVEQNNWFAYFAGCFPVSTPFVWHFPFYNSVTVVTRALPVIHSTFFPGNCNPVYFSPSCIWGTGAMSIAPTEYHFFCFS